LHDPQSNEILGYEAFYLGTAKQLEAGNPATFEVRRPRQEIGFGDRLLPASSPTADRLRAAQTRFSVDGRVISVYGGVDAAGRGSIISINRGTRRHRDRPRPGSRTQSRHSSNATSRATRR
jgi:hypothetical protein